MSGDFILIMTLYVNPGRGVSRLRNAGGAGYGPPCGRIERVIRPTESLSGEALPHEIHVVSFPSAKHFTAYRSDSALAALQPLRQVAIAKTSILVGRESKGYDQ